MSLLTAELMGQAPSRKPLGRWHRRFGEIADRLVAAFGSPQLGNVKDPVEEVFYIMLSARTTGMQYQKTHATLWTRFPNLRSLAAAPVEKIVPFISCGGLANKRAAHACKIAAAFLRLGENPARQLVRMSTREVFEFLNGLPGMGPKSAFCVMMYSLGYDVFPVDTNVQRVAVRVGAIPHGMKHYQAQQQLPPLIPEGRCKELHVGMVVLGRQICLARTPRCFECPIRNLCATGRKRKI